MYGFVSITSTPRRTTNGANSTNVRISPSFSPFVVSVTVHR
jgi:hypothetical protein